MSVSANDDQKANCIKGTVYKFPTVFSTGGLKDSPAAKWAVVYNEAEKSQASTAKWKVVATDRVINKTPKGKLSFHGLPTPVMRSIVIESEVPGLNPTFDDDIKVTEEVGQQSPQQTIGRIS